MSEINEVEAAKIKIKEDAQRRLDEATKEYNTIVKAWAEKHSARLLISGKFSGSSIKTTLQIVLNT